MLSVENKPIIILGVVILGVVMLSVVMLSVVMLSVFMLSVVMLSVAEPLPLKCWKYLHMLNLAVLIDVKVNKRKIKMNPKLMDKLLKL
jgi:hypothetical protein